MYYCNVYVTDSKLPDVPEGEEISPQDKANLVYLGSFSSYNIKAFKSYIIGFQGFGPIVIRWSDTLPYKGDDDVFWGY